MHFKVCCVSWKAGSSHSTTYAIPSYSFALALGCNQNWIAEQTGTVTSIAMTQGHYGKYICDDDNALLRSYIEKPKITVKVHNTGTFAETFSAFSPNYANELPYPRGWCFVNHAARLARLV